MYKRMDSFTALSPVPVVMVSCAGEKDGEIFDNIITIAWAGTVASEPPAVSISIRKSRLSHELITKSGEFVINLVSEENCKDADWCGVKSGRDFDKFKELGLEKVPVHNLEKAKGIKGCPVHIGCKVKSVTDLGSHDMFVAEIVSVAAAEELFDTEEKLRLDKAKLVAYCHGEYLALGDVLGFFGYSVAAPKVLSRRMDKAKMKK